MPQSVSVWFACGGHVNATVWHLHIQMRPSETREKINLAAWLLIICPDERHRQPFHRSRQRGDARQLNRRRGNFLLCCLEALAQTCSSVWAAFGGNTGWILIASHALRYEWPDMQFFFFCGGWGLREFFGGETVLYDVGELLDWINSVFGRYLTVLAKRGFKRFNYTTSWNFLWNKTNYTMCI